MILLPASLQYWKYRSILPHPVYIVQGVKCRALCTTLPTVIPSTYLQPCINLAASENSGPLQNLRAAYVRLGRLRASESQWQVRPQSVIVSSIVPAPWPLEPWFFLFVGLFLSGRGSFPIHASGLQLVSRLLWLPVTISARTKKTSLQACPAFPSWPLSFGQLSTGLLGILLNGVTVKARNYVCYGAPWLRTKARGWLLMKKATSFRYQNSQNSIQQGSVDTKKSRWPQMGWGKVHVVPATPQHHQFMGIC